MTGQLTIAAHILAVLSHHDGKAVTSEQLAEGFGTNPVVIRRAISLLKRAGLVSSRPGVGGGSILARPPDSITLLDAYLAIQPDEGGMVIGRHSGRCGEGVSIAPVIAGLLNNLCADAEEALRQSLKSVTISEFTQEIAATIKKQK